MQKFRQIIEERNLLINNIVEKKVFEMVDL